MRFGGKNVLWSTNPEAAISGAHAVFTDTWVSMGQEEEAKDRLRIFSNFQITKERLKLAQPGAIVQHCLPAYRGKEISQEVFEEHATEIFDEAENRLHVQKAVMVLLMENDR
jgi:ornithine carbamoyltransferase